MFSEGSRDLKLLSSVGYPPCSAGPACEPTANSLNEELGVNHGVVGDVPLGPKL